jgi:hypothetical protein
MMRCANMFWIMRRDDEVYRWVDMSGKNVDDVVNMICEEVASPTHSGTENTQRAALLATCHERDDNPLSGLFPWQFPKLYWQQEQLI